MLWFLTIMAFYFIWRTFTDDEQRATKKPPHRRLRDEEELAFKAELKGKTQKELWALRNEYHAKLVKSHGTEYYSYYLDCIGVIDEIIYASRK